MNGNGGQVNATLITPNRLIKKLVDASALEAPAVIMRTTATVPNLFVSYQAYRDNQIKELLLAFTAAGMGVAKELFPTHQGLVDGLCLAFDTLGKIQELMTVDGFDLTDALDLGQLGLDDALLTQIVLTQPLSPCSLTRMQVGVGFIVKVRDSYFAGEVTDPLSQLLVHLPDQALAQSLYRIWQILTAKQFRTAVAIGEK